ncbi:uncharacterized protein HaLaN_21775, partial [Haematococcus lacustris]
SGLMRLAGEFQQTGTSTGRLAMGEPNLQTVPRPADYEMDSGPCALSAEAWAPGCAPAAAPGGPTAATRAMHLNIRSAFIAPPGCVMLAADYCQVELRMMAHLSQDAVLCGMLQQPGADPFKGLAASWLQIPQDQVTSTQRAHAKQLAYGMLYGMGPAALAASLGVTPGEALALSTKFMQALPGVEAWIKKWVGA